MTNRIEPPILMSRLMVFVFASSMVVLGALLLTLYNMFPLNRPQVFFLTTRSHSDTQISVSNLNDFPNKNEIFKQNFIREYIKARNEVVPSIDSMRAKWNNDNNGIVYAWSNDDVYSDFIKTGMWGLYMSDPPGIEMELKCPVNFTSRIKPYQGSDTYEVEFIYYCVDAKDNNRQTPAKSYTVRITLDQQQKSKWVDRLANPLGIKVVNYEIVSGNGDPLDGWNKKK